MQIVETVRMADARESREFDKNLSKSSTAARTKCKRLSSADYLRKTRQPFSPRNKGEKDIFVTNKTNFKAQLKKCERLFDNGASEIIIHGLGAAVYRACALGLQLKEIHCGAVDLDIKTSSVPIIDDFEPLTDDVDCEVNERLNSAVHIRVFRTFTISGLKYKE